MGLTTKIVCDHCGRECIPTISKELMKELPIKVVRTFIDVNDGNESDMSYEKKLYFCDPRCLVRGSSERERHEI
jgi:hypothetical protein